VGKRLPVAAALALGSSLFAAGYLLRESLSPGGSQGGTHQDRARIRNEALTLASAKFTLQDWSGAEQEYTRATKADPTTWRAWHGRALSRVGTGDFNGALHDFDRAIALDGTLTQVYGQRGVANARLGRFDAAVADFTRAIALKPGDGGSHLNRAQALEHMGDLERAQADYEKAIAVMNPLDPLRQMVQARLSNLGRRRGQASFY
jgi:Flp pilus assembly protein TadD